MKQHSLDTAITTTTLACQLSAEADPKYTLIDFVTSTGQVGTALLACWMLNLFA